MGNTGKRLPKQKPLTQLQREYQREYQRVQRLLEKEEKQGYIFQNVIPPSRPKRVTRQAVDRLHRINRKELHKNHVYISGETGEYIFPPKKQPTVRQQYEREVKRIQNTIKRAEKQGINVSHFELPQFKKITTNVVKKLKSIRKQHILPPPSKQEILEKEYQKQIKRIQRAIDRGYERGFFTQDYQLPQKPKKITQKEIDRLKDIKPTTIYQQVGFVDEDGVIYYGKEAIKQQRLANKPQPQETGTGGLSRGDFRVLSTEEKIAYLNAQGIEPIDQMAILEEFGVSKREIDTYIPLSSVGTDYEIDNFTNNQTATYEEHSRKIIHTYLNQIKGYNKEARDMLDELLKKLMLEQGIGDVAQMLQNTTQQFKDHLIAHHFNYEEALFSYCSALINELPNASEQYKKDLSEAMEYGGVW